MTLKLIKFIGFIDQNKKKVQSIKSINKVFSEKMGVDI
jgi:hypothetical protein